MHLDGLEIGELSVLAELQSLLPGFQDLDYSLMLLPTPTGPTWFGGCPAAHRWPPECCGSPIP